jgi:hypothetical protein
VIPEPHGVEHRLKHAVVVVLDVDDDERGGAVVGGHGSRVAGARDP